MRQHLFFCGIILLFAWGCSGNTSPSNQKNHPEPDKQSQDNIAEFTQHPGEIIALMDNSLTSYFIYKGQPMGFEYEMLSLFAKENNLKLKVKIIYQTDHILDSLKAGVGDIAAANLTISEARKQEVSFTKRLFRTKTVLVQRLPDDNGMLTRDQIEAKLIRDRLDLEDDTVIVRKNSSYELLLKNLIRETGIKLHISYSPGDMVTENIIEMISNGDAKYTLCDQNKAYIFDAFYENIDVNTPMGLSQPIAWAVNRSSTKLLDTLNDWIDKRKNSLEYNLIYNRYFELDRRKKRIITKNFEAVQNGNISIYDDLIRSNAQLINWDWRLLAALIYQESHFDKNTLSWRGAVGLMQLMPATAKQYGIPTAKLSNATSNLQAGVKHLDYLQNYWKDQLSDSLDIIKFTLGSYNVGLGHVQDAMRLAEEYHLNSKKWDGNVAEMLLKKSIPKYYMSPVVKYGYCRGREPVNYVRSILTLYHLYIQYAPASPTS